MSEEYKYYTCRYDAAFKEVFLQKDTSLLKTFLEFVLKIRINDIVIKNTELNNDNVRIRRKLVDSIIYTDEGVFNIEVNTSLNDSIMVRNTSYLMNAYSKYFMKGENYNSNCKFIQINLNYNSHSSELFNRYYLMNDNGKKLIDNFMIYHFNMDKYMEFWYNKDKEEIENYKYLIMLDLSKEDLVSLSKKDKVVSSYMERLNYVNEDPRFQSYMSAEEDNRKMLNTYKEQAKIAEEKLEEAEAKVKEAEKNAKEKAEQSFTNGLEQGKIEAYKEMLNNGVDIALIAKSLNISVSEAKSILLK